MPIIESLVGVACSVGITSMINGWRNRVQQDRLATANKEHGLHLQQLQQEFQSSLQQRNFAETERLQKEMANIQYQNALRLQGQQDRLATANREHSLHLQQLQQEFQSSLQQRNFAETERLQKEMANIQYQNALRLQESNQIKDWESHLNKIELANVWPLCSPPLHYLRLLESHTRNGKLPLQIILPASMPDGFQSVYGDMELLFNNEYRDKTFYYDGGWKEHMGVRTAQKLALQQNLSGCPTLILIPEEIKAEGKIRLSMTYWGIGAMDGNSSTQELFSIHKDDFRVEIIKKIADEFTQFYQNEEALPHIDKLIRLRKEEQERYRILEERRTTNSTINPDEIIALEFNDKYLMFARDTSIARKMSKKGVAMLSDTLGIVGATLTDVHRLLDYQEKPHALSLIDKYSADDPDKLLKLMADCYTNFINQLSSDTFNLPLYYALVASAFNEVSGGREYAKQFSAEGWKHLQNLYPDEEHQIIEIETHREAYGYLSKITVCPMHVNILYVKGKDSHKFKNILTINNMKNINELNNSISISENQFNDARKKLESVILDPCSSYDLTGARKLLAEALEEELANLPNIESLELSEYKLLMGWVIEQCRNGKYSIAMIGEYQSGKTTTSNALCGGRYVAPMGFGVNTSAMPIIFSHAKKENESVKVQWKTKEEFSFVFSTMSASINDFNWKTFDIADEKQRCELLKKLDEFRNSTIVDADHKRYFAMASMILKWFGSQKLEQFKQKSLSFEDVQVLGKFSDDIVSRWDRSGIDAFSFEESMFPLIRQIECRVCSDLLSNMHCNIIDCPGLFANSYDTQVTLDVMSKASAILYILPYHKAISEEGVGENLIRLQKEYKDIHRKLFIANNLQFSHPNSDHIEKANRAKVCQMFGETMSFVSYDARLAFLGQMALSKLKNSLDLATQDRFISEVRESESRRRSRFRRAQNRVINDFADAMNCILREYDEEPMSFQNVYKISDISVCLEELNRFVMKNEAYSLLVSNGIVKLEEGLRQWKTYLDATHLEPHLRSVGELEQVWNNRCGKAAAFAKNANEITHTRVMNLKESLSARVCEEVFPNEFFDSLYKKLANAFYARRWEIIRHRLKGIITLTREQESEILVRRITVDTLRDAIGTHFVYMNNLLRKTDSRVGKEIIEPAIQGLISTLDAEWYKEFSEDKSFQEKRSMYYAIPSDLSFTLPHPVGASSYHAGEPGFEYYDVASSEILGTTLSVVLAAILGAVTAYIVAVVLDTCIAGGLISISAAAVTIGKFIAAGYTFKEAFEEMQRKVEEKSRDKFIENVVNKLKNEESISRGLRKGIKDGVKKCVAMYLGEFCSKTILNEDLLKQHKKEALDAVRNGTAAQRYEKAVSLVALIDKLMNGYIRILNRLSELQLREE